MNLVAKAKCVLKKIDQDGQRMRPFMYFDEDMLVVIPMPMNPGV